MHTILVPVDGSVHALKALTIACDLAQKYDGQIALLHILAEGKTAKDLIDLAAANTFGPKLTGLLKKAEEKALGPVPEQVLRIVGDKILEQAQSKVERQKLEVKVLDMKSGDPASAILTAQKSTGANTIVMGCRGIASTDNASSNGGKSFGSVSQRVFERAPCTCLSVK
ncbi:MAG: universal stress protein [Stappiaceae bacterium]